jgi:hypothetical protein
VYRVEGRRTVVPAQLEQDFAKPRLNVLANDSAYVLASGERNWVVWVSFACGGRREG